MLTLSAILITLFCSSFISSDNGGIVTTPITGKVVCVINKQKSVPEDDVRKIVSKISDIISLPILVQTNFIELASVGASVDLIDVLKKPRLTVIPEDSKATINISALKFDNPSKQKLLERLEKEFWRSLAYSCGAIESELQPCLLRNITSLKSLDEYPKINIPNPIAMSKIVKGAENRGISLYYNDTYINACCDGWAPFPTNEIQKKIYKKYNKNRRSD
jgi:hypothetical protein